MTTATPSEIAEAAYLEAVERISLHSRTGSQSLNLSDLPALNRLPSLSGLAQLHNLNLRGTGISDLSPLQDLKQLRQLNITETNVETLDHISELSALQVLGARSVRVSDATPIGRLYNLKNLNLRETYIKDISPFRALLSLQTLVLAKTKISDISPLEVLPDLRSLNLRDTRVSDISALRNLSLEALDISRSRVSDLLPIAANLSLLASVVKNVNEGGIRFDDCPLTDANLREIARLQNPQRTQAAFSYLRKQQGIAVDERQVEGFPDKDVDIPPQGVGPHFALRGGLISFAPPSDIDAVGNHVRRLEQLHPLLKEAVNQLLVSLNSGNVPHGRLLDFAMKYHGALNNDLSQIQFSQLFGYGLRIQNAFEAAQRSISDRSLPELDDAQQEALTSVLDLHAPFILSSAEGTALLEASDRYDLEREQRDRLRSAAIELSENLENSRDVIEPKAAEFILESARGLGEGPRPEKAGAFGEATVRNATVVLIGGAVLSAVAYGFALAPIPTGVLVFVTGALAKDGIKNSKIGKITGAELSKQIDRATLDFVIKNESSLRKFAGDRRQLAWVHGALDWIRKNCPKS